MASAEEQFTALYRRHHGDLLRYFRRRCTDPDDAWDLTAEVFALCWRRWGELGAPSLPWLYRSAGLLLRNQRRAGASRLRLLARLRPAEPAAGASAERLDVLAALALLPEADREVLRLVAWEGLDNAALAEALGCSGNAAAVRLHRARTRLRRHLDPGLKEASHG